jgi:hypothetical protein
MNIEINLLEAASELAHEQTIREMLFHEQIVTPDDVYVTHENGDTAYTEDAQDTFNHWYDHYYELLNNLAI